MRVASRSKIRWNRPGRPRPPYSAGQVIPAKPASARRRWNSLARVTPFASACSRRSLARERRLEERAATSTRNCSSSSASSGTVQRRRASCRLRRDRGGAPSARSPPSAMSFITPASRSRSTLVCRTRPSAAARRPSSTAARASSSVRLGRTSHSRWTHSAIVTRSMRASAPPGVVVERTELLEEHAAQVAVLQLQRDGGVDQVLERHQRRRVRVEHFVDRGAPRDRGLLDQHREELVLALEVPVDRRAAHARRRRRCRRGSWPEIPARGRGRRPQP